MQSASRSPLEASSFQPPTQHSYLQHRANTSKPISFANPQRYGYPRQQAAGSGLCPSSTPHVPVAQPLYDFPIDSEIAAFPFSSPNNFLFPPLGAELPSSNPNPQ